MFMVMKMQYSDAIVTAVPTPRRLDLACRHSAAGLFYLIRSRLPCDPDSSASLSIRFPAADPGNRLRKLFSVLQHRRVVDACPLAPIHGARFPCAPGSLRIMRAVLPSIHARDIFHDDSTLKSNTKNPNATRCIKNMHGTSVRRSRTETAQREMKIKRMKAVEKHGCSA